MGALEARFSGVENRLASVELHMINTEYRLTALEDGQKKILSEFDEMKESKENNAVGIQQNASDYGEPRSLDHETGKIRWIQ
ncbi:MAG: hypothetical protein OXG60_12640, partial [Chloroflexi bacterium]|nr:hypothetical protein [Chloroflexota bacterium]